MIVPNEKIFFELLAEQSSHVLDGAKFLDKALSNGTIRAKDVELVHEIEKKGDHARHEIVKKLNQSFITPFDREDIFLLSGSLDDILDEIDRVMYRFKTYNKLKPSKESREMSKILLETVHEVNNAVAGLQHSNSHFLEHLQKVSVLEEKADVYYRSALEKLFRKSNNAKEILIEKDLIEFIEEAIDKCEEAAVEIEGIILKST